MCDLWTLRSDLPNNEQQCDVWEGLRGCQCLIPALDNNSYWNWNKLSLHVTRPEGYIYHKICSFRFITHGVGHYGCQIVPKEFIARTDVAVTLQTGTLSFS